MVYALAGRRIDPPDIAAPRFPLRNVSRVRSRLQTLFEGQPGRTLVSSAACGADLIALDVAGSLGWMRHIILPFDRNYFRDHSVTDRPGDWGAVYDRILDEVSSQGGMTIRTAPAGEDPYSFCTCCILEEAARLSAAPNESQTAIVVWDGQAYSPLDLTAHFAAMAEERKIPLLMVSTLD